MNGSGRWVLSLQPDTEFAVLALRATSIGSSVSPIFARLARIADVRLRSSSCISDRPKCGYRVPGKLAFSEHFCSGSVTMSLLLYQNDMHRIEAFKDMSIWVTVSVSRPDFRMTLMLLDGRNSLVTASPAVRSQLASIRSKRSWVRNLVAS